MKQSWGDLIPVTETKGFIKNAELSFRHQDCTSCECYLGYITKLEIDSGPDSQQFLSEYKPDRDQIHSRLGCDPFPPGILYSN